MFLRRRCGRFLWDSMEITQSRRQTKYTEHASKKIKPSKRLELYIFLESSLSTMNRAIRTLVSDRISYYLSGSTPLVAQCSATPATVPATPPCSATPFQTQISVRHLPGMGGGGKGATPKFSGGVARHRCYTCKTL